MPRLLIVGASTRAAAWSAVRAGWRPVCADLFADRDLAQVAEIIPVAAYPESLPQDLCYISTDAWMFVGAMENHRATLAALRASGRFGRYCGPELSVISQLRDPTWLAERWRTLGCSPDVCIPSRTAVVSPPTEFQAWLRKPLASGGGREIRPATADDWHRESAGTHYLQRRVTGVALSALLLITGEGPRLLMLSEQLLGWPEVAAPTPFTYCGSIGPMRATEHQLVQLRLLAETLLDGLDYRGLLGLDLIWDGRQLWVIEVNPRYTASSELWEFAARRSAVGEQLAEYGLQNQISRQVARSRMADGSVLRQDNPLTLALSPEAGERGLKKGHAGEKGLKRGPHGKLILFADRDLMTPDLACCLGPRAVWSIPWIADVPASGAAIPAGAPLCTVFARGVSTDDCRRKLLRRAERVRGWFNDVGD